MEGVGVLDQDRPDVGERQRRCEATPVGVHALVIDDPEIVAFAKVVAKPNVGRHGVSGAVELDERVGGHLGVERRADAEAGQMRVKALIPIRKADPVEAVEAGQFQVRRDV